MEINDDDISVVYTNDAQLAVYPDDDLNGEDGFVAQEQARYAGQPVPDDIVKRYFWWYRYLLLNEKYAECCKAKGEASPYRVFYEDWGDIFAMPFPDWWIKHGRKVAGLTGVLVQDVTNDPDLGRFQTNGDYFVLAIDLRAAAKRKKKAIAQIVTTLVQQHLDNRANPICRVYGADACDYEFLGWAYEAYIGQDAQRMDGFKPDAGTTAARIGVPVPEDIIDLPARRKVNDWKRDAKQIIDNALQLGRFPVYERRKASRT